MISTSHNGDPKPNGTEPAPAPPVVVIGASAGGVEALIRIAQELPADLGAAVFVTMHFPSYGTSVLPQILSRAGSLPAAHAQDGQPIAPGHLYVAPPDHHLLLTRDRVRLSKGPRENGNRPAIDAMFRSAGVAHGKRVVGVVLTGNLDDGTAGLMSIKRRGGVAIVQEPTEALFPSMPSSAAEHVDVDDLLPLGRIAAAITIAVDHARRQPMPVAASAGEAMKQDGTREGRPNPAIPASAARE